MFLICGEALFDVFEEGDQASSGARPRAVAGGSPFNVAIGLARLGVPVSLATSLSGDDYGCALQDALARENVDVRFASRSTGPTPCALVSLDEQGIASYRFRGLDEANFHPDVDEVAAAIDSITAVHVGSFPLVTQPSADRLLALLERVGEHCLVTLDPNVRLAVEPDTARWREQIERFARYAHVVKASLEDIDLLYPGADPIETARRWLSDRCRLVVVTRGGDGALLLSQAHGAVEISAAPISVVDTVGAGDTFQAAMLAYLHANGAASPTGLAGLGGGELERLAAYAIRAAGVTCSRRGPDLPYRNEIDMELLSA
ncbi:carbohydrate kinase [Sphingomonas oleivorans]|uniref:Carbohydrate kinase n=1 Tax=Sphingomonas oleivorans TaxID=1735121 RepID=A0A2T5G133_9SPHN|nr:carbohydrate kinase [Sphingomonas oleivorans]PTQ12853.1 carbohydrate kinase [Sphingomonas oleivorans]